MLCNVRHYTLTVYVHEDAERLCSHFISDSNCCLRQYCGPSRPFAMSIVDNTQKEVIHIERPLRCSCWCCFCCLQTMEVQSPPGTVVGYVEQV